MRIVANVSFSGRISMAKGEMREIGDADLLKDLLEAGYIREIAPAQKSEKGDPNGENK